MPVSLPPAIRAVLFDAYGTLVQIGRPTRPYRQLLDVVRARRPDISKEQCARDIMCQSLDLTAAAVFYDMELSPIEKQHLERDLGDEISSIQLFPEVPHVLRTLRARGYRLGVCSNLAAPYVWPVAKLVGGMVDVEAWSCEIGAMKPDPTIYDTAAARFGVAHEAVLMVGDSYRADVEGPRQAGFRALHLDRRNGKGDLATLQGLLSLLK